MSAVNYNLQQSIVTYLESLNTLSGSALSGSNIAYYGGIDNGDIDQLPAAIVYVQDAREMDLYSNNYEFTVQLEVMEMAADTTQLGTLAGNIFNEFLNSKSGSINFTNKNLNIGVWAVLRPTFASQPSGDALINTITATIYGAPIPNV